MYDLIVIGSGAAGLSAGLYAGRYRMKTLIIEGTFGGATATAGTIENYPGVKNIDGYELMRVMKEQAGEVGAEMKSGWVNAIRKENGCFVVTVDEEELHAKAVVFAGGSEHRKLGVPNEKELTGRGVHYCITCDGPVYTGKTIAVVGGGDASVKGSNLAAEYAEKIYIIVRGDKLRSEPINREHLDKLGDKIEVFYETEVKEIVGDKMLEKVILSKEVNGSKELVIDGLFVEIGSQPQTDLAESLGADLDEFGYIKVNNMMKTSTEGFFAAGDTVNHFGRFKQDVTASAMGSMAATSAYEYSKVHGELCSVHKLPPKNK